MGKWLLLDGFNLAYRCFFAIPELTRSDGFPTNALHGWIKTIWKLQDQEKPERIRVYFDLGGAQDRLALLPEYKAQREDMPEELERQLPKIKELTRALGAGGIESEGVESDDLLASDADRLAGEGGEVWIVSADKDFAQCVDDRIRILLPPPTANPRLGWRTMDRAGVEAKFGVSPDRIPDYLALVGDVSDNIPGIPGVGPKTAARWIGAHGDLGGVLAAADRIKPERFRPILAESGALLRRNLELVTLRRDLPPIEPASDSVNPGAVFRLLEELEMRTSLEEARRRYGQGELFQ